eukprot:TRINITY_DN17050_c0_g1_i1.p1 TRINITY_DN17050_c0_g1~~TRINITY_DN17050_c0_g1_i1.p1  ORF type:complete len:410 (+),score=23.73 TRINITY_DN17050_c0_g1_i1:134-1363(+)
MAAAISLPLNNIFLKAATAMAQAGSMAGIGLALGRLGVVDSNARKVISALSMKLTIPCLLFSSILSCPHGSHLQDGGQCPELSAVLRSAWPMMVLPFIWAGIGAFSGLFAVRISCTPDELRRTVIASCAFGNSTGLPIVLLTALSHSGDILSLGVGIDMELRNFLLLLSLYQITYPMIQWTIGGWLLKPRETRDALVETTKFMESGLMEEPSGDASHWTQRMRIYSSELCSAALVPPVIAVLLATTVGMCPLARSWLVNTSDFDHAPPFGSIFRAISSFGQAAVPLNMLVLGSSLASVPACTASSLPVGLIVAFSKMVLYPAVVWGILFTAKSYGITRILMPDEALHHQMIVVAGLVSATPTANNMSVMAEIWGGPASKQTLACMIFVMYSLAPFLLTAWIVAFVRLAN